MKPTILRVGMDPIVAARNYADATTLFKTLQPKIMQKFQLYPPGGATRAQGMEAFDETCKFLGYKQLMEVGFSKRMTVALICQEDNWDEVELVIVARGYRWYSSPGLYYYNIDRAVERAVNALAKQIPPGLLTACDEHGPVAINLWEGVRYHPVKGIVRGHKTHTAG